MKRNLLFMSLLAISALLFESFGDSSGKYPSGSPGGYTGSPHDGQNCKNCHSGQALQVSNWITSNVPAGGYVPGTSYTITVTATGSGKKGFEVSPQTTLGAVVGILTAGTGNHLVNSNKAITHSSASNASTYNWNFTWVAPTTGVGDVTFYGAIIVGLSNTKLCTLVIPQSTTGIADNKATEFSIFPNPATEFINMNAFIPEAMTLKASIYTIRGELVKTCMNESVTAGNFSKTFVLPSTLKRGVYLFNLEGKSTLFSRKFVVN